MPGLESTESHPPAAELGSTPGAAKPEEEAPVVSGLRQALDRRFIALFGATAIPVAVQSLISSTRPLIDSFLVSRVGTDDIAAMGYSVRIIYVIMMATLGMADGGAVVVAQYRGSGDAARTREATAVTVAVSAAVATAASLLCFVFAAPIAGLGTSDPVVAALSTRYIRITVLMILPYAVISALAASLRCFDLAKVAMRFSALGLVLHLALSYTLVLGDLGAPRLGLDGSAWATVASAYLECLGLAGFVYLKRHPTAFRTSDVRAGFRNGLAGKVRAVGSPVALSSAAWAGGLLVYTILVGRAGEQQLAALSMINPIESAAIAVINGVAVATTVIIGKSLGASTSEAHVWAQGKALLLWNAVIAATAGALLFLTSFWIADLYGSVDARAVGMARAATMVLGAVFIFRATSMTLQNGLLRAGGDTLYILRADLACQWLVGIPLTFLTAITWRQGFPLVYLAIYSEEITKSIVSGFRVRSKRWIHRLVG